MNKTFITGAVCACVFSFFTTTLNAALVDNGDGLIYDSVLDITWLQDANWAFTSGHDDDGRMGLPGVESWVDGLVYAGHSNWRMASVDLNDDNVLVNCATASLLDCAADNELAYMYFHNIGGTGEDRTGNQIVDGITLMNIGSLGGSAYWGGRLDETHGEYFHFKNSNNGPSAGHLSLGFVWAVHDGNITAVIPLPAAVWLFGSGLLGLIGIARRKKA